METAIRPARPEDAAFLGWAILTAGRAHLPRGWYDIALGLPDAECIEVLSRLVLASAPSWWSYRNFLVAEMDGREAGALCGFAAPAGWGSSEAAMAEAVAPLGWGEAELAAVWTRGAYVFTCAEDSSETAWVIENVAVRPEARGRGIAGQLLEVVLDRGRAQGHSVAQLSFVIGNAAAERAYAKAGFRLAEERRHPDFEAVTGAPGLRRYVRALSAP